MKKISIGVIVLVLLAGGAYFAFGMNRLAAQPAAAAALPAAAPKAVVAEAKVVPLRSAALSLPIGGMVAEVLVSEGDQVTAGQVIARLDATQLTARVASAKAALAEAQANYENLKAGATPEQIAEAEAQLAAAQAQAQRTAASVTAADVAAAQAQIQASQQQLRRLQAGPKETALSAAQANLSTAQANLVTQRDQLSANKTAGEVRLQQSSQRLIQAQSTYSMAKWNWEEIQRTGNDPVNPSLAGPDGKSKRNKLNDVQKQQYADAFTRAEADLRIAEATVHDAQVALDNARQAESSAVQAAEQQVASAQANLDSVAAGIDPEQISAARQQMASGQAQVARLKGAPRQSELDAAQAGVAAANATLGRVKAGRTETELSVAHAQIESRKADLELATIQLAETELKAPFDGVIAQLQFKQREYITSGTPIVQLADTATWQIETADLTELNIVKVNQGDHVSITFDALPGFELPGTVKRIEGFGENRQGDIVYTVTVQPDQQDPRLKWNMTASVSIEAK
jgi:HlyD family secretion protein